VKQIEFDVVKDFGQLTDVKNAILLREVVGDLFPAFETEQIRFAIARLLCLIVVCTHTGLHGRYLRLIHFEFRRFYLLPVFRFFVFFLFF
jgi:hypothetical protein